MSAIRTFVRRVPQQLLNSFLQTHSIELSSEDLAGSSIKVADVIEKAIRDCRIGTRGRIIKQIELIDKLASEAGQNAINEVALADELRGLQTNHARALWLFLNDAERFRQAEDIVFADEHRYTRMWNSFEGPKGARLRIDGQELETFKATLCAAFDTENVHIEILERNASQQADAKESREGTGGPCNLVQFAIYREGTANDEFAFVDNKFTTLIRSPVLEAAVVYNAANGIIDCVAKHKESRAEIVRAFAVGLLGCDPNFEPCSSRTYDLSVLQERMDLATDPIDGIEKVSVAMLKLYPVETTGERVTIEKLSDSDKDIWAVADDRLGEGVLKTDYRIAQAMIQIAYRTQGSNRLRKLPITITHPHRSNIKEQTELERIVAGKYLEQWGLMVGA